MSRRSGIRADAERQRIALQRQAVRRECRRDGSRRIVSSEALRTGHAPLSQHPPPPDFRVHPATFPGVVQTSTQCHGMHPRVGSEDLVGRGPA